MANRDEIIERGLKAALTLAAETPWPALTLSDIAKEAGLSLADFHGVASKADLAEAAEPFFDKAMSMEIVDMTDPPRARLFEAIMLRFEAMEPFRAGLLSLMKWRDANPAQLALTMVPARRASADWALASAGLDTSEDAPLALKTASVAWAIAKAERAWRKETSADFTRTMAALDKELRDAEDRLVWLRRFRKGPPGGANWRYASDDEAAAKPETNPAA